MDHQSALRLSFELAEARALTRRVALALMASIALILIAIAATRSASAREATDQYDFTDRRSFLPAVEAAGHLSPPAPAGGRPSQCPVKRWCGCALALQIYGEPRPELWRARNWLKLGRALARPTVGAIVVYARGQGGHVGRVTGVLGPNLLIVWSGNDRGAIRERARTTANVIGYRQL